MKNWIFNKFFKKEIDTLKAEAKRQGSIDAFEKAVEDLKETNVYETDKLATEIAEKKLNDLLSPVDLRKIVTLDKQRGIVFIGGEKAEDGRLSNLKSEAEFLLNSDIWALLSETPKELASRAMFVSGETLADLQKGKSILYMLSTQKNIIETLKGYIQRTPPTGAGGPSKP